VILEQKLADETATVAFGGKIAQSIIDDIDSTGTTIYLHGDLGAGKTTLTRGIVTGFGHQGHVKSPTYTLVEPYELAARTVYHFDLYRLADPEELEFMGIRDYFADNVVCVVEWPQRGQGFLPTADILVDLVYVEHYRQIALKSNSIQGERLIRRIQNSQ
jgi:tRNA threonylcarbamoyladenosine biosynthesis protein TsaE